MYIYFRHYLEHSFSFNLRIFKRSSTSYLQLPSSNNDEHQFYYHKS